MNKQAYHTFVDRTNKKSARITIDIGLQASFNPVKPIAGTS